MEKIIKIGNASAQLLDSVTSVEQLLGVEDIRYIVFDYLGEGTMGYLGMMSRVSPEGGYARDFIDLHVLPYLETILARGIRVVANAGGLDPKACAEAMSQAAAAKGLKPCVAYVEGDDLRHRIEEFRRAGHRGMFDEMAFPDAVESVNAYLGGFPIADALARGADIVIVGRSVDSAVTLGPLIHEFGWKPEQHDLLAAGTLVGHLLECGYQAVGGTYTDWRAVPDWTNMGFPVAECRADGSAVITKPAGTGGCVLEGTVIEQMLYEVNDPQAYFVPDVTCDFTQVKVVQQGVDRVHVSGAIGRPPTATYKVCATYHQGWRATVMYPIVAVDAVPRAERLASALFDRVEGLLEKRGLGGWRGTHLDVIGSEQCFGPRARTRRSREVMARMVVEHKERAAVELFSRESYAALTMSVGSQLPAPVAIMPSLRVFSFLLNKAELAISVTVAGETRVFDVATQGGFDPATLRNYPPAVIPQHQQTLTTVPLMALALARSGEKGNLFNVAVIARRPEFLPYLSASLTPAAVADWYHYLFDDPRQRKVDRYEVPGCHAINFVVHECLAGGIQGSMRMDAAGKGMAQVLMDFPVSVPVFLRDSLDPELVNLGSGSPYVGSP